MIPVRARFEPQNYYSDCKHYTQKAVTVTNTLGKKFTQTFCQNFNDFFINGSKFCESANKSV